MILFLNSAGIYENVSIYVLFKESKKEVKIHLDEDVDSKIDSKVITYLENSIFIYKVQVEVCDRIKVVQNKEVDYL